MGNEITSAYRQQTTLPQITADNNLGFPRHNAAMEQIITPSSAQWAREGRLWQVSNPARETALAMGGTSFSDTAPMITLDVASGTTMIPRLVILNQGGTVAGGVITVLLTADNKLRFSSGGTALTPANCRVDVNSAHPTATAVTAYYGTTAGAITAAAKALDFTVEGRILPADVTPAVDTWNVGQYTWRGGDEAPVLRGPASFVIYASAATTQPSFFFRIVWAEVPTASIV